MYNHIKIVLDCILKPHNLNKNYKESILDSLRLKYNYTCKHSGYIIDIVNIIDTIHNYINSNNDIVVSLLCLCKTIELKKGVHLNCKIDAIYTSGVFVSLSKIKILIPNKDNFTSINNECHIKDRVYRVGDYIDVIINTIRFEKNEYTCLGTFKDV